MKAAERGFLLLTSSLGDPDRHPLTTAQVRKLFQRSESMKRQERSRDVDVHDLTSIGYSAGQAKHIVDLLCDEALLEYYLMKARRADCVPLTRATEGYPLILRKRLGMECPGVLWAKGDLTLLETPMVALVGSRDLGEENRRFAAETGRQAALQGYTLVSGNARGADRTAQNACLEAGGKVVIVVADSLEEKKPGEQMLYLSEDSFDAEFSAQRALSRNRCIHALGLKTFVAQTRAGAGGTWDGTVKNLQNGWSQVFGFRDGSEGMARLEQMGAELIDADALGSFYDLPAPELNLFDR